MRSFRFPLALGALLGTCALVLLVLPVAGCGGGGSGPDEVAEIPVHDPSAVIDVSAVWNYDGTSSSHRLFGTITMTQQAGTVTVTGCTYANAPQDRSLEGTADLDGNQLVIHLVPVNGDTDFSADCTFLFSEDVSTFFVEFEDTNGDTGAMGSYKGTRPGP